MTLSCSFAHDIEVPWKFRLKTQVWWVTDVGRARSSLHLWKNVPILLRLTDEMSLSWTTPDPLPRCDSSHSHGQCGAVNSGLTVWLLQATGQDPRNIQACRALLLPRGRQCLHAHPPNPGSLCLPYLLFRKLDRTPASFSPGSRGSWRHVGSPRKLIL